MILFMNGTIIEAYATTTQIDEKTMNSYCNKRMTWIRNTQCSALAWQQDIQVLGKIDNDDGQQIPMALK